MSFERSPLTNYGGGGCANRSIAFSRGVQWSLLCSARIASGAELSVGERTKSTREKKGQNKSVSWGGETQAVSHEKTSLEGILKRSHVAKPRGQKICKERG